MEDLRQLIRDEEAVLAPESLGYRVRGLNAALADLLRDGRPDEPYEKIRYLEMVESVAWCAELLSGALARWLGAHQDNCEAPARRSSQAK